MSETKVLEKVLKTASEAYYNSDTPIMSDEEFDKNLKKLIELDENNSFLKTIGCKPSEKTPLTKVSHEIPMTSLNNVNNPEELSKWIRNLPEFEGEIVLQPKLDGASIELIYKDGEFTQAITRGDGFIGEDITHTILKAKGFPRNIGKKIDFSVRCEAIITTKDWEEYIKKEENTSNPRNTVCGLIRRLDTKNAEFITCIAFDVIIKDKDFIESEMDKIYWLKTKNFEYTPTKYIENCYPIDTVLKEIDRFNANRMNLPYETDGVVIKINYKNVQKQAGTKDNRPKWGVAWKFSPSEAIATVLEVNLSIGTTGIITPVAEITPARIGGTTITNVSLCNFDEVKRLGLTVGDKVTVVRSGDVIPKITKVVEKYQGNEGIKLKFVKYCPCCGKETVKDGAYIKCGEPQNCPEVQFKKTLNWIEKRNIMFLGESNLGKIENYLADRRNEASITFLLEIPMLYKLNLEDLISAKLGDKMSEKILNEINKSKETSLEDFLGSLSLPLLGKREVKNLIDLGINTADKFLNMKKSDIINFEGFKETKAGKIVKGIKENKDLILNLCKYLEIKDETPKNNVVNESQSFCFTGAASLSRKELSALVIKNGGIVKDDVSKDLDFLVLANINSSSSKTIKARKYGVKLISEEDFLKMI